MIFSKFSGLFLNPAFIFMISGGVHWWFSFLIVIFIAHNDGFYKLTSFLYIMYFDYIPSCVPSPLFFPPLPTCPLLFIRKKTVLPLHTHMTYAYINSKTHIGDIFFLSWLVYLNMITSSTHFSIIDNFGWGLVLFVQLCFSIIGTMGGTILLKNVCGWGQTLKVKCLVLLPICSLCCVLALEDVLAIMSVCCHDSPLQWTLIPLAL